MRPETFEEKWRELFPSCVAVSIVELGFDVACTILQTICNFCMPGIRQGDHRNQALQSIGFSVEL